MFKCDCCGLCCMNLDMSSVYSDLDRGDGICIYFNCETHLCTIYDNRPIKCNIDVAYDMFFRQKMSKEEFYQLNYQVCNQLKEND